MGPGKAADGARRHAQRATEAVEGKRISLYGITFIDHAARTVFNGFTTGIQSVARSPLALSLKSRSTAREKEATGLPAWVYRNSDLEL